MGEPVTVPLWRLLALHRLVEESDGTFAAAAAERPLLAYYSNAIVHLRRS